MSSEEKFIYANRDAQVKRVNAFVLKIYVVIYIVEALACLSTSLMGYHSMASGIGGLLLAIVASIAIIVISKMPDKLKLFQYTSVIFLAIFTEIIGLSFGSPYIRYCCIVPMAVFLLYFDSKLVIISSTILDVSNLLVCIIKTAGLVTFSTTYGKEELIIDWVATLIIGISMCMCCFIERVVREFNRDALGKVAAEKEEINEMMTDILAVAEQVRAGTSDAMELMEELTNSSDSVSLSMKDIADSTQLTAENIQTQTVMTQNIQEDLSSTLDASEAMFKISKDTAELNTKSMNDMESLKKMATTISSVNNSVSTSMEALVKKADDVKNIATTIFAISSQTNLLALNASIESARAGEAGRGFAVVADEIRQLAERTREETENISVILDELSKYAGEAGAAVKESVDATNAQDDLIQTVSESFEAISSNVEELTQNISDINERLENLSQANNQIVDNISQLSATTEEVTASSAQAEQLSEQNVSDADKTKNLLEEIFEGSKELTKYQLED